jgi:hypothetical protein
MQQPERTEIRFIQREEQIGQSLRDQRLAAATQREDQAKNQIDNSKGKRRARRHPGPDLIPFDDALRA